MNPSSFNHAIVRPPSRSCVHGLRAGDTGAPDYETFCIQHSQYVAALKNQGLEITELSSLEAFPDAVFVEDVALCLPQGAVLLRPGTPSRAGEVEASQDELTRACGSRLHSLQDGHVDGGDIMLTDRELIIGLSSRTNELGVTALEQIISPWGYRIRSGPTPDGVLHFKSDSAYLGRYHNQITVFDTSPRPRLPGLLSQFVRDSRRMRPLFPTGLLRLLQRL